MDAAAPRRPPLALGAANEPLAHSRVVLLLVDFINPLDFDGADALAPAALAAARATAALKQRLAQQGLQAIYANDNYGRWRSNFGELLAACQARPGAAGEIARLLAPAPSDLTLLKPRHSCFYATPLELLLGQLQARELVITGLAADLCVQMSAMDARMRGYPVWVPQDCTAAEAPRRKRASLDYLHSTLDCRITASTDALAAEPEAGEPPSDSSDAAADSYVTRLRRREHG
jgi:nicotinamidase-related amidase